jgi:hypothetical protein
MKKVTFMDEITCTLGIYYTIILPVVLCGCGT